MFIDLPPHIEQHITAQAQIAGLSTEHYIIEQLTQLSTKSEPNLRQLGGGEHFLLSNLDKFDEPLDDFKDYM